MSAPGACAAHDQTGNRDFRITCIGTCSDVGKGARHRNGRCCRLQPTNNAGRISLRGTRDPGLHFALGIGPVGHSAMSPTWMKGTSGCSNWTVTSSLLSSATVRTGWLLVLWVVEFCTRAPTSTNRAVTTPSNGARICSRERLARRYRHLRFVHRSLARHRLPALAGRIAQITSSGITKPRCGVGAAACCTSLLRVVEPRLPPQKANWVRIASASKLSPTAPADRPLGRLVRVPKTGRPRRGRKNCGRGDAAGAGAGAQEGSSCCARYQSLRRTCGRSSGISAAGGISAHIGIMRSGWR